MRIFPLTCTFAIATLVTVTTAAHAAWRAVVEAEPRAVIELFTSPDCSACPEADALFVKLARNPDLITLVMPVDIWARPSRKDQLAMHAFNERQMAYADIFHEGMLFTPQAMINGAVEADGSDASEIGSAIDQTRGVLSVPIKAQASGQDVIVSVGAASNTTAQGVITVLPYERSRSVRAHGGKITYANLVRDIVPLGDWSGQPVRHVLPLQNFAHYDGVVVLLQSGTAERPGAIIGAARVPLRTQS